MSTNKLWLTHHMNMILGSAGPEGDEQTPPPRTGIERQVEVLTAELRRQEAQFSAVLDTVSEGVMYVEKRRIRHANVAFATLVGYSLQELIGQPVDLLLGASDGNDADNSLRQLLTDRQEKPSGQPIAGQSDLIRKDGVAVDVAFALTFVEETGSSVLVVHYLSDEQNAQKQQVAFVANVAHELRTPMTSLKTRLYLLRRQPERFREHVPVIERAVEWMATLVDDLLDYSRLERGQIALDRQLAILQDILTQAIALQEADAVARDIHLTLDMPLMPLYIHVDPLRLLQVITNLVVNALNYTPRRGDVSIRLAIEDDHYLIQVRDTGIGIHPEHLVRIFEPFFRVNERQVRGTGLGLTISRAIVEAHNGSLTVESEPGRGSVFSIRLPRG